MSYLVLARKYRPQRFTELVGQEHVARTLTNAIEGNRVHHAFLFTGARGVGKTSAARILAKALSCAEGPTANPCGKCEACQEIVAGRSVDVVEIDGASNTGVDDVRTLREGARYMPAKGRLKIYIIDEVHMLSTSAFNALLKTLEEPPPHVVFIFATTEAHKIPTTILSRCQRYDFKLIPTARLTAHLEEILKAEAIPFAADGLRLLARQAAGSVRDGLSLLDQIIAYVGTGTITAEVVSEVLGIADRTLLGDLARAVLARDAATTLRTLAAAAERGLDLGQLSKSFLALLRDIEVAARVPDPSDLVDATPDELAELAGFASTAGRLASVLFDRWARAVEESGKSFAPRLVLEMAAVDLCQAEPLEPLGDLIERLEALEGRLQSGGTPSSAEGGRGNPRPLVSGAAPRNPAPAGPAAVPATTVPPPKVAAPAPPPAPVSPGPGEAAIPADTAPTPPKAASPMEAWRRAKAELERRRPRVGALLASASILEIDATTLVLGFADRTDVEAAERVRADIEQALTTELGSAARVVARLAKNAAGAPVMRAEISAEAEALAADKRGREQEARQHPIIQKAQDLFGASIREIKT
ncbi:MAG: DNA polymerase III subunit gamma/tau [Verrucomicrobiota bacterium]